MSDEQAVALGSPAEVPGPPVEVKIRTFESDLRSMTESGGGPPQPKAVKSPEAVLPAADSDRKGVRRAAIILLLSALLLGAGFALYRLGYPLLTEQATVQPGNEARNLSPDNGSSVREVQPLVPVFEHESFFRNPPHAIFEVSVSSPAASANDLRTHPQKVRSALSSADPSTNLYEVELRYADASPAPVTAFLASIDAEVLNPAFLAANFDPDFTYFAYRDANGEWPGVILKPKPEQSPPLLAREILKLELSPKLANLFLESPGSRESAGFSDGTIAGQPIRSLDFENPGATLVYGWFHGYCVISTSEEGLRSAISLL
ncbi:hypothetical protein C4587_02140 [Candidatus Parcubacteria bacterium]|nr:MAG: hypothetical protein C4587_02140 [Candidatus Parcubacteria bacterium]